MRNKILIVIPSRARPGHLLEAVGSILSTSCGYTDVLAVFDNDDPTSLILRGPRLGSVTIDRRPMLQAFNHAVMENLQNYEIFGFAGDDVRYRTQSWDYRVYKVLSSTCGVAYGNDCIQCANLPTHPFFSGLIPSALGYAVPPTFRHYYFDNYMRAIGLGIERYFYLPDVVTEHLHHSIGKSSWDQVYQDAERGFVEDGELYEHYARTTLPDRISFLKNEIFRRSDA